MKILQCFVCLLLTACGASPDGSGDGGNPEATELVLNQGGLGSMSITLPVHAMSDCGITHAAWTLSPVMADGDAADDRVMMEGEVPAFTADGGSIWIPGVPVGLWDFTLSLRNAEGAVLYSGTTQHAISIQANMTADISITLSGTDSMCSGAGDDTGSLNVSFHVEEAGSDLGEDTACWVSTWSDAENATVWTQPYTRSTCRGSMWCYASANYDGGYACAGEMTLDGCFDITGDALSGPCEYAEAYSSCYDADGYLLFVCPATDLP